MSVLLSWVLRLIVVATLVLAFAWALAAFATRIWPKLRLRKVGLVVVLLSGLGGVVLWVAQGGWFGGGLFHPVPAPAEDSITLPSTSTGPSAPIVVRPPPPLDGAPVGLQPVHRAQVETPNTASIRVFFGTDRRPLKPSDALFANAPTAEPGGLSLGWCSVSVPRLAHWIGQIERPTFWTLNVSDWFENSGRHFVITERPIVGPGEFWQLVREVVDRGDQKQVLLFIHGYNVSFDDAIYRTAELAFDLNFAGAAVLYSWPSNAATLRYVADKDHSLSTLAAFKTFLVELSKRSGARTIHVIAHSMGNNALLHALAELVAEQQKAARHFREIIMAAPDVDRREFLRLADAFQSSADRITLYAASNDRALGAAEVLQGDPRVGDASPMFLHRGIDSIDASMIIKGFLKHSYFADPRILDDIQKLLTNNTPPPRFGLMGMPTDQRANYWRFRP